MNESILHEALRQISPSDATADWPDVLRRADQRAAARAAHEHTSPRSERTRRSRRKPILIALAATVAVAILAVPAFGLDRSIVQLFSSAPPAPTAQVLSFESLDKEAPSGMAPGVVPNDARVVIDTTLSTGEHATLALNPTNEGGFCFFLGMQAATGSSRGASEGCDANRKLQFAPGILIPGPIRDGEVLASPVVLSGSILVSSASELKLTYQDGASVVIPITWVSDPINAGFYVYGLPANHWSQGHRPATLVALDSRGKEVATQDMTALDTGFAPGASGSVGP